MLCKKGVPRNFVKFTEKHLCQSFFFNKVAGLTLATLLKKRLWHRCFPVIFAKFLSAPFLIEHLRWLLLYFVWSLIFLYLKHGTHASKKYCTLIHTPKEANDKIKTKMLKNLCALKCRVKPFLVFLSFMNIIFQSLEVIKQLFGMHSQSCPCYYVLIVFPS